MLRFHGTCQPHHAHRVVALPGTFNPPTIAHLAMARQAASRADTVVLVLPERLPHKEFDGASFPQRLEMLLAVAKEHQFLVGSTPDGLYVQIAHHLKGQFPGAEVVLACGADAARRTVEWQYGDPGALSALFSMARLWVFARGGDWSIPAQWAHAMERFDFDATLQAVSASQVRQCIHQGEPWEHLVPESIRHHVETIFRGESLAGSH